MLKVLAIAFLLLFTCCKSTEFFQYNSKNKIEAIEVRNLSPVMGVNFYRTFCYGDLVMYQSQYRHSSYEKEFKHDSESDQIISDIKNVTSEVKERFFVFHKDSSYGYNYDPFRDAYNNVRLRVDSISRFIKGTNKFETFLEKTPDSIIWSKDKSELKEVFLTNETENMPAFRVILHYSKKMNHIKESFNEIVDKAKGMKLFKIESYGSEFYSRKDTFLFPPSYSFTEMSVYKVQNPEEILQYFRKYNESITTDK